MIASKQVERVGRGVTHSLAECVVCGWRSEAQLTSARDGTRHVRAHGHTVHVEQAIVYTIRRKVPRA